MRLELKDMESSVVYTIDESGAVLGRERARTDINFRDESISKRHARIFANKETWFLEDLGSSNGTYMHDERISRPTPLVQGVFFCLAQRRFEVLLAEGEVGGDSPHGSGFGDVTEGVESEIDIFRQVVPPSTFRMVVYAFPRALLHFGASVPWLALNPAGSVRRSADEKHFGPLGAGELAVYGFIAIALSVLVGPLVHLFRELLGGGLVWDRLTSVLPRAGFAAPVGALAGVLIHPVLDGLVVFFRGDSDARSRTNCALDGFTFVILFSLAANLSGLLTTLSNPVARGLVPVAILFVVGLVGLYLLHQWALAFGVIRSVRLFSTVLGGGVLSAVVAQSALPYFGDFPPDMVRLEQLKTEALARAEAGGALQIVSPNPRDEPGSALDLVGPSEGGGKEVTKSYQARTTAPISEAPTLWQPRTAYTLFVRRRSAIELAIESNPALLERPDLLDNYTEIWRKTFEIRERWKTRMRNKPRWEKEKIYARRAASEVFRQTKRPVKHLYETLLKEGRVKAEEP